MSFLKQLECFLIAGEIDVQWQCPDRRIIQAHLVDFQQNITVFDPHPVNDFFRLISDNPIVAGVVSTLLATFLGWLCVLAWRRIRKGKPKRERKVSARRLQKVGSEKANAEKRETIPPPQVHEEPGEDQATLEKERELY